MDLLARIFDWLSNHEAAISAVAAIIVIGGVVLAGFRLLVQRRAKHTQENSTEVATEEDPLLALPTGPVVAVLPFENLSRNPDQEYFSDGLTDDIITALSRFKDLFVIARNSTFRYKGQAVDVRQLNRDLGARYVLEGSVQRAGGTLRVTAQLLDAKDGTHLWAESYDRELSAADIFAVQDEITEQVAATIPGVVSQSRLAQVREKPTDRLDAYEWVLKAAAYDRDNLTATEHAEIRDGLEHAVKSDPGYAGAWAWLAVTYLNEHSLNLNPRPDPLGRALDAARRAATLDPSNQFAHQVLADVYFQRHDLDLFFAEAERAIALNPNAVTALAGMGIRFHLAGDERGIGFVEKAVALDPFHPTWLNFAIAHYHFKRGEYEEALAAARRVNLPALFSTQIYLAAIYAELGLQAEAHSALEELERLYPGFTIKNLIEERQKWNESDDMIRRWVAALRKAGLPEGTGA